MIVDNQYVAGECPKGCGREAEYQIEGVVVWLYCYCGYRKVAYTVDLHGNVIVPSPDSNNNITIPRDGTMLSKCLLAVARNYPIRTVEVAHVVSCPSGDTATQLTILGGRGLITRTTYLRGLPGGSTWVLTPRARELLGVTPPDK